MKFPILKSCSILIVSAAIVFVVYKNNACSFFYDCDEWHYAFFNPELIQQPHLESFFVTCHGLHDNNFMYSITDSSIAEWQQYFNNQLELPQLNQLFQLNQNETKQLAQSIEQNTNVNQSLSKLYIQLAATKNTAAINYFLWAKKTEPLVQAKADYWSYEPTVVDTAVYLHNIAALRVLTENTSDVFLKQRYAFQVLRTLFYLGDYQACIAYYETKFKSVKMHNSITARALSYYAGCHYRLKDYATSNYLFSKIYRQHPALKESAFLSFHPWSDSDWDATLAMAKNNIEKETLWHLFGIYADPLKGMQEILKINSKSNFADLLLVRAINILERDKLINNHEGLFENVFYNDESSEMKIYDSSVSFRSFKQDAATDSLIKFVNYQAVQNKNAVWLNAAAYLNWLQKDNETAAKFLQLLSLFTLDKTASQQYFITDALLKYSTMHDLSKSNLDTIAFILNRINADLRQGADLVSYISVSLANNYLSQKNYLMAEMCLPNGKHFYKNENDFETMLAYLNDTNHSVFEKFYIKKYPYKAHDIVEYKAVQKIKAGQYETALKLFKSMPESGKKTLPGNPFNIRINDCHDCDHLAKQNTIFTKQSYCEKMVDILKTANASNDSNIKSYNYFLYANGLYNQTYYGNGRTITSTFANESGYVAYNPDGYSAGGCQMALKYYQLALNFATSSELKAKYTWMSAKCELNNWYASRTYKAGEKDFEAGKYFKQLKTEFSHTKYITEVIDECGYFCTYMGYGSKCIKNEY